MSDWVNDWLSEWWSEWWSEWLSDWVSDLLSEWVSEYLVSPLSEMCRNFVLKLCFYFLNTFKKSWIYLVKEYCSILEINFIFILDSRAPKFTLINNNDDYFFTESRLWSQMDKFWFANDEWMYQCNYIFVQLWIK